MLSHKLTQLKAQPNKSETKHYWHIRSIETAKSLLPKMTPNFNLSPCVRARQQASRGQYDVLSTAGPLQDRLRAGDTVTLRLKCTAKIGNGYWKSTEESTRLRHRERLLESRSASASNGTS